MAIYPMSAMPENDFTEAEQLWRASRPHELVRACFYEKGCSPTGKLTFLKM